MELPSDPMARKRIARALVALSKLPPQKRREILERAKAARVPAPVRTG